MLPFTADVVIVGGGVIGTSIAYQLALRGCSDVVLVDRGQLGSGSTSRASGGIRQQFADEIEIQLARDSVRFWESFEQQVGGHLEFRQVGYLYLLTTDDELRRFTANVERQRRHGVPSRLLSPVEVAALVPGLTLDGVRAGAFCPTDGRAVPSGAVDGLARAARRLGARLIEDVQVTGIEVGGGRVAAVETTAGRIATRLAVDAAGPWAAEIAALAGVACPVFPKRFHQFVTGPVDGISPELPCILEPATTLFVAPEGSGVLLGMDRVEPGGTNMAVEWDFLPEVVATAIRRLPKIESADIRAAWAGLIELTPDGLPIVGQTSEVDGLILACGLNGHGFMLAPAIGRSVAELICDGRYTHLDLGPFGPLRFADGAWCSAPATMATTA